MIVHLKIISKIEKYTSNRELTVTEHMQTDNLQLPTKNHSYISWYFLLMTKIKSAKLITENSYPLFILETLNPRAEEIQCHNHAEFLQVMLFLKALNVGQQ